MEKAENLLLTISSPADLRKLEPSDLILVISELRQFIIDEVCNNPGHFGASLGVVELTVALHYVFNTPYDKIIWDTYRKTGSFFNKQEIQRDKRIPENGRE
jgi:1-deoxy-D-xylulose-5-phosphate synthase